MSVVAQANRRKPNPKGVLECLLCFERYSAEDVARGDYQIETLICSRCYREMQLAPHSKSCFGKPTVIMPDGKKLLGYDVASEDCSSNCPDRSVCCRIVSCPEE